MPEVRINAEEELHKTILEGSVAFIRQCNQEVTHETARAFTEGFLYNLKYEELLQTYAMDVSDAFFTVYSMHGPN